MAVPHGTHIAPEGAQPHPGCNPAAAEHRRDTLSLRDRECLRPGSLRPQRVVNVGASCRSNGHYRHEEGRLSRQRGSSWGFIWFPAFCFQCLSFAGGEEGGKGRADPVTSILRAGVGGPVSLVSNLCWMHRFREQRVLAPISARKCHPLGFQFWHIRSLAYYTTCRRSQDAQRGALIIHLALCRSH